MGSQEFAASLYNLWYFANGDLPEVGQRYANANQAIANAGEQNRAFGRTRTRDVSMYTSYEYVDEGRVFPHWDRLRDALQDILATSTNNTFDTAQALLAIMNNYAETDSEAKQVLMGAIKDPDKGRALLASCQPTQGHAAGSYDSRSAEETAPPRPYPFEHRPQATEPNGPRS